MAKYLVSTTEVYRVDDETEAEALIESAKQDGSYVLTKYNRELKERKNKGEVIDSWVKCVLVKTFGNEKNPEECYEINIKYE